MDIINEKNIDCKSKKCRYFHENSEANNCILNLINLKDGYTLQEVGDLFNITRMRVCQIEKKAISKLKSKSHLFNVNLTKSEV